MIEKITKISLADIKQDGVIHGSVLSEEGASEVVAKINEIIDWIHQQEQINSAARELINKDDLRPRAEYKSPTAQ